MPLQNFITRLALILPFIVAQAEKGLDETKAAFEQERRDEHHHYLHRQNGCAAPWHRTPPKCSPGERSVLLSTTNVLSAIRKTRAEKWIQEMKLSSVRLR